MSAGDAIYGGGFLVGWVVVALLWAPLDRTNEDPWFIILVSGVAAFFWPVSLVVAPLYFAVRKILNR